MPLGIIGKQRGLGEDFEILRLFFKRYSACRWSYAAIDGVLQARKGHNLKAGQISRIRVHSFSQACYLDNPRPDIIEQAQYSIPFLAGSALIYGGVGHSELEERRLNDPSILAVADRVILELDSHLDSCYPKQTMARIEITTISGERIEIAPQSHTREDFQNPLTPEEMEEKFKIFAGHYLARQAVEELLKSILAVETLGSGGELTRQLAC